MGGRFRTNGCKPSLFSALPLRGKSTPWWRRAGGQNWRKALRRDGPVLVPLAFSPQVLCLSLIVNPTSPKFSSLKQVESQFIKVKRHLLSADYM